MTVLDKESRTQLLDVSLTYLTYGSELPRVKISVLLNLG